MREVLKKHIAVFLSAFALNWLWEIVHSRLYAHYQGGTISLFILMRAAAADALILYILIFVSEKISRHKSLFVVLGGLMVAAAIELWALKTGRWAYNEKMPIVPVVGIGLSPLIQLAITGLATRKFVFRKSVDKIKRYKN